MQPNSLLPLVESKAVGIWIRVSTEDQAQGESPEIHLERAKAYALARGWTVKEIYNLAGTKGWSGKTVKEHSEAKRMLADIQRGHVSGLIFSKLARLARNTKELLEFADYFRDRHADLISISETIDTSTPAGRLFFTIIAAMAQWEREEIGERMQASILTRAKLGKPLNANAPYGYQWVDRKLVVHPEEAVVRRKAFDLFLQHRRKGAVAKLLNAAGHRSRTGKPWRDILIGRMLTDTSAKGVHFINRYKEMPDGKMVEKPSSQWGTVPCEPILPEVLWNQVNQVIEEQSKTQKKPGKTPVYTFSGLAWCVCGGRMYVRADYPKYFCRKCNHKIDLEKLEAVMHEALREHFGQPERVNTLLTDSQQGLTEKEATLSAQQREVEKVRADMTRTHRLYLDGHVTAQGFGDFYKPAEERLNQLVAERARLEGELAHLRVRRVSADEVVADARGMYERWPQMSAAEKRQVVETMVERITIGPDEIDITYAYQPVYKEPCNTLHGVGPG